MSHVIPVRLKRNGFGYEHSTNYTTQVAENATAIRRNLDIRIVTEPLHRPRRLWEDKFSMPSL